MNHYPVEGISDFVEVGAEADMKAVSRFVQHQYAEINGTSAGQVCRNHYRCEYHASSKQYHNRGVNIKYRRSAGLPWAGESLIRSGPRFSGYSYRK
jgi:hypothetical protein